MPAFDDMLALEERAQALELEIGKARDLAGQCGRRLIEINGQIQTLERTLDTLRASIWHMKKVAPVPILSEYEFTRTQYEEQSKLLQNKKQEAKKLLIQGRAAQATIPGFQAQLQQVERQLESYNQVIPFRQ